MRPRHTQRIHKKSPRSKKNKKIMITKHQRRNKSNYSKIQDVEK
jgi:hypothetical protein